MTGPVRPTPPSAIDGYRRLERTRRIAAPDPGVVVATAAVAPRPRRRRPATPRIAGALRLLAFVSVLAVIVGTSVTLASADTRPSATRDAEPATIETSAAATRSEWRSAKDAAAKESAAKESDVPAAPAAEAEPVEVAAAAAPAPTAPAVAGRSSRPAQLPFTGVDEVLQRVLLAGAALVLFGMLVQIAGQPLPARARARR